MQLKWWKYAAIGLLVYTIIGGLLFDVPRMALLNETIRNLNFHVPMWFGMLALLGASAFYSIRYLQSSEPLYDLKAVECAHVGMFFGVLGMLTGMMWAKFTWGSYWSSDPKQNASAIAMMVYMAYFILRGSLEDQTQKRRIGAVYNIFAIAVYIPLIYILPRLTDSLHPGNGGNPGFNAYDLDSKLRLVFYPAVIGWILLGAWFADIRIRYQVVKEKWEEKIHA